MDKVPELDSKYPVAFCIDCDTDMTAQRTRRWRWTGTKLEGPVCNPCMSGKPKEKDEDVPFL